MGRDSTRSVQGGEVSMKSPSLVSPPHFPTLIAPRSVPLQKGREERTVELSESAARLDRALADALPDLSRSRVQALMGEGAVTRDGEVMGDLSARAAAGVYRILIPAARPADPEGEDIALDVLFEDEHLIVIDKPAGMSAHPAPGSHDGTLVNALIHHCGASLSGIGGVARPGIVHRLDKNTSGVMVAAKTDAAHRGLSELFAAHDLERVYLALTRGAPAPGRGEIRTRIGRSTADRKKMAVLRAGGREAITHYTVAEPYGPLTKPLAARVSCRLETGRTHQIRVHLAHKGAPCLGDPTYGAGSPAPAVREAIAASGLRRQALHAAVLGFRHPVTGVPLRFETSPPSDMTNLQRALEKL
jgi:23S rRNA pseudouridine1911/1915/1917 synthase